MANEFAIATVARTILRLIEAHCPRREFAETPVFAIHDGSGRGDPVREGFTLVLWRVTVDGLSRDVPPSPGAGRPPAPTALPLRLSFLLTPWAQQPERQLRLLGWALRFIAEHPVLPAATLNECGEDAAFAIDESLTLRLDELPTEEYLMLCERVGGRSAAPIGLVVAPLLLR